MSTSRLLTLGQVEDGARRLLTTYDRSPTQHIRDITSTLVGAFRFFIAYILGMPLNELSSQVSGARLERVQREQARQDTRLTAHSARIADDLAAHSARITTDLSASIAADLAAQSARITTDLAAQSARIAADLATHFAPMQTQLEMVNRRLVTLERTAAITYNRGNGRGAPRLPYKVVPFLNGEDPTQEPHSLPLLDSDKAIRDLSEDDLTAYFVGYTGKNRGRVEKMKEPTVKLRQEVGCSTLIGETD